MVKEQILIIDDKVEIITFLTDLLEPLGYGLATAYDGREGLNKALAERPDLILLDVNMPGMSGIEVLEGLQRHDIRTPTILMTLYGSESVAVQAFRLGARNYVTKPIDINELLVAIEWALEEGRLRRERERLVNELAGTNKQLTRRMRELATLHAIGRSVASLMPLQQLLHRIVDAALYLSNADAGSLFLVDEASGQLHLEAIRQGDRYDSDLQSGIQDSHAQDVVRSGKPLWIARPTKHTGVTGYLGKQVSSLLYVPVKFGGQVIGVVGAGYLDQEQEPSPEIQKRLTALADYAAIALQNAHLHEAARETAAIQAIRQTMVTISHYLNNSLQALLGTSNLLKPGKVDSQSTAEAVRVIGQEVAKIAAVLSVLRDIASAESTAYHGTTQMLDIERELEARLASATDRDPAKKPPG